MGESRGAEESSSRGVESREVESLKLDSWTSRLLDPSSLRLRLPCEQPVSESIAKLFTDSRGEEIVENKSFKLRAELALFSSFLDRTVERAAV